VDELNAQIGLLLTGDDLPDGYRDWLERIQNDLFDVGADLSVPGGGDREPLERIQNDLFDVGADLSVPFGIGDRLRVEQAHVGRLEQLCDDFNADLPMLKSFVLPGGTPAAARLNVARTTCRRAERDALTADGETGINPLVLAYLNRLSDFLFIAARWANADAGRDEPLWKPGGD